MAYNTVPTVATGNSWSAAQHNTYIRDNFTALWPYTTAGDIAVASSASALSRLPKGVDGTALKMVSGSPAWAVDTTLQDVYPVGSVYMSTASTDPATTFGFGTWTAVQGKMLIGADGTYAAGSTGGAATHTLTSAEMPTHTHTQNSHNHTQSAHTHTTDSAALMKEGTGGQVSVVQTGLGGTTTGSTTATNTAATAVNQNAGSGGAHNNLPPYLAVYIWTRTA